MWSFVLFWVLQAALQALVNQMSLRQDCTQQHPGELASKLLSFNRIAYGSKHRDSRRGPQYSRRCFWNQILWDPSFQKSQVLLQEW